MRAIHTSRNAIIATLAILGLTSAAVRTATGTLARLQQDVADIPATILRSRDFAGFDGTL